MNSKTRSECRCVDRFYRHPLGACTVCPLNHVCKNETLRPVSQYYENLRTLSTGTADLRDAVCVAGMFRTGRTDLCKLRTAASGWRIHCGVEVTELSTNKQRTLPQFLLPAVWRRDAQRGSLSRKPVPHTALGWCIHCGVEVTELSTNKQHTLSRTNPALLPPETECALRASAFSATQRKRAVCRAASGSDARADRWWRSCATSRTKSRPPTTSPACAKQGWFSSRSVTK